MPNDLTSQKDLLLSGAANLGVPLSPHQMDDIILYLAELKKWNRKINLTAITDDRDVLIKHVLDSLSYRKGFLPFPGLRLLDMGSGAGFPAIPLKIACPEIVIFMVESVKKKASFLRHIIRLLHLEEADVLDVRTEELPNALHGSCDVVTARAFADIAASLTIGAPLLRMNGLVVLSRGPEESVADRHLADSGIICEQRIELTLPHSDYPRALWVFRIIR